MWVLQKAEAEVKGLSETMLLGSVTPESRGEEEGEWRRKKENPITKRAIDLAAAKCNWLLIF